ncbi:hypothetical protein [Bacillus piscicola]|uniref:hypothetical protein n=1 Tax=Bacillus piscicola TaxID=1632684 RepID=UPI001F090618|nr:hypothetical protein [Bacillus piscicola]
MMTKTIGAYRDTTNKEITGHKLYRHVNKRSAMDVTQALNHFVQKNNDNEYKGKIIFSITQLHTSEKNKAAYQKAYVDKAAIKPVLHAIASHNFPRVFTNGFTVYGGSIVNGEPRARVFKIQYKKSGEGEHTKRQYVFTVDEGLGRKTQTGAIQLVRKDTNVQAYISYEEALKMSHEVLDFIHHAELAAMINGKPLYTEYTIPTAQQVF